MNNFDTKYRFYKCTQNELKFTCEKLDEKEALIQYNEGHGLFLVNNLYSERHDKKYITNLLIEKINITIKQ